MDKTEKKKAWKDFKQWEKRVEIAKMIKDSREKVRKIIRPHS